MECRNLKYSPNVGTLYYIRHGQLMFSKSYLQCRGAIWRNYRFRRWYLIRSIGDLFVLSNTKSSDASVAASSVFGKCWISFLAIFFHKRSKNFFDKFYFLWKTTASFHILHRIIYILRTEIPRSQSLYRECNAIALRSQYSKSMPIWDFFRAASGSQKRARYTRTCIVIFFSF